MFYFFFKKKNIILPYKFFQNEIVIWHLHEEVFDATPL